MFVRAIM